MVKSNTRLAGISFFVSVPLLLWMIVGIFFFETTTNSLINISFLLPPVWFFALFLHDGLTTFRNKPQVPLRSHLVSLIASVLLMAIPLVMFIEVLTRRFGIDGLTMDASWYSILPIIALIGIVIQSMAKLLDSSTEKNNQDWLSHWVMVVVGLVLLGLTPFLVA